MFSTGIHTGKLVKNATVVVKLIFFKLTILFKRQRWCL